MMETVWFLIIVFMVSTFFICLLRRAEMFTTVTFFGLRRPQILWEPNLNFFEPNLNF